MRLVSLLAAICLLVTTNSVAQHPNIVLLMADDMGWAQTGYNGHPALKTPHLDAMAANGLRFDRFYAGSPVCSPSRASVLTGRSNDRTGVRDHGFALRRQEKTLPGALQRAGYRTAHFGKWHLNGIRGGGVPVLANDPRHPGHYGFDAWLSATNYFDRDPILGTPDGFVEFTGDSSEVIVAEALKFIEQSHSKNQPSFSVVWYGSPHHPARSLDNDKAGFADLDNQSKSHHGELVAMDRSVGTLRNRLRELNIAENTLVWFCSDNGGLSDIEPSTVGNLRGFKGSLYEGGIRVPSVIEWPSIITKPRITSHPAVTMDIFPTIAEIVNMPDSALLHPTDGQSLVPLFTEDIPERSKPIPFRYSGGTALIDNPYKLVSKYLSKMKFGEPELYDLSIDSTEQNNIATEKPEIYNRMKTVLAEWEKSVEASAAGKDYPEGSVNKEDIVRPQGWSKMPEYEPHLETLLKRPEYRRTAEKLRQ